MNTRLARLVVLAAAAATLWTCSGERTPAAGQEKGHCYPNGTCNQGLSCFSSRCVRYDGAAGGGGAAVAGAAGSGGAGANASTGGAGANASTSSAGAGPGGSGGAAQGTAGTSGTGGTTTGGAAGTSGAAGTAGTGEAGSAMGAGGSTDGGTQLDTGQADALCGAEVSPPDDVIVPSCGQPGTSTRDRYTGTVWITVSGVLQGAPGSLVDPFYIVAGGSGACPFCFVYNRDSEGPCLCGTECPTTSHHVSDIVVGGYPAYSPTHEYTVQIDLGAAAAERINFAFFDCGCFDNSGNWNLTMMADDAPTCGD